MLINFGRRSKWKHDVKSFTILTLNEGKNNISILSVMVVLFYAISIVQKGILLH